MGDHAKDSRFSHIASDPRFKTIPRSQRQVKIDKRFQSMFNDKRFKIKYTVDKRGRPISKTSNEDLGRYYNLSSGSSESEADEEADDSKPTNAKVKEISSPQSKSKEDEKSESSEEDETDSDGSDDEETGSAKIRSDDEEVSENVKSKLKDMSVDYARGEGALMTDSSSDEDSSEDEDDETVEHGWGEFDRDAERTEEVTSRLAVCNMDWDRIRAVDLMVLFSSFTPPGGLVRSVNIYPSEFGLERMKIEEEEGPPELVQKSSKLSIGNGKTTESDDTDSSHSDHDESPMNSAAHVDENEEGSSYHMEKLRQYQLNRLKYFYAIVEFDSPSTANHIYTECDGMEYESSATRLDLRFVPDDTTFEQEPREACTEMPDTGKYRPRQFTTTALQQAKVDLTWDETDPARIEITNRLMAGDTVDDNDLQAYLASSTGEESDDDEEEDEKPDKGKKKNGMKGEAQLPEGSSSEDSSGEEEDPIAKYRSLLAGIEEDEKKKKNDDVHMEISWGLGIKEKAEDVLKKKKLDSQELTPFQEMMEKRKQKKLEKKKEKSQKKMPQSGEDNAEGVFSDDDIPSDIDMNDPYFAEEFKDHKASKSKGKPKKKGRKKEEASDSEEQQKSKAELELLLFDKDEPKHFNFKKIQEEETSNQSKRKRKAKLKKKELQKDNAEDDFKINVDDNRFSALYSSHHYNIDPTDPHFRKSHGMDALISAKHKRLSEFDDMKSEHNGQTPPTKKLRKDAELSLLIKSVKNKAQNLKK